MTMVQLGRELHLMRAVRLDSKNSSHCILHIFSEYFILFSYLLRFLTASHVLMPRPRISYFLCTVKIQDQRAKLGNNNKTLPSLCKKKISLRLLTNVHRRQLTFILRKINTWLSVNRTQNCTVTYLASMNTRWY